MSTLSVYTAVDKYLFQCVKLKADFRNLGDQYVVKQYEDTVA